MSDVVESPREVAPEGDAGSEENFNLAERIYAPPPATNRRSAPPRRDGYNLAARIYGDGDGNGQGDGHSVAVEAPPRLQPEAQPPEGGRPAAPAGAAEEPEAGRAPRRKFSLRTFESLSHAGFRYYLLSMLGQMASLNMQQLVRGFLVFELTGSYAALGTIFLVNSIPGIALSAFGGVLADRVRRKKPIIQIGQLLNATNAMVVGLLLLTDVLTFQHLIIAAVAHGTVMSLMMPARQAMLPEVIGPDRLMNAVALNSAGMNATRLMMPALAGFLVAIVGAHTVYFLITGLYLYAVAMLTRVTTEYAIETEPSQAKRGGGGLTDLVDGLRYMMTDPTMRVLLVISTLFAMLSMPNQFLLAGFVSGVLDQGPDKLGLLMSVGGVGSLVGSLLIASLPAKRRGLLLIGSGLWLGIALLGFASSTSLLVTTAIMLFIGIGDAGRMSLGMVLVQAYTRPEYRGRVMSLFMMQRSFATFGTFFVGVAASWLGLPIALGGLAIALTALSLWLLVVPGHLRRIS